MELGVVPLVDLQIPLLGIQCVLGVKFKTNMTSKRKQSKELHWNMCVCKVIGSLGLCPAQNMEKQNHSVAPGAGEMIWGELSFLI